MKMTPFCCVKQNKKIYTLHWTSQQSQSCGFGANKFSGSLVPAPAGLSWPYFHWTQHPPSRESIQLSQIEPNLIKHEIRLKEEYFSWLTQLYSASHTKLSLILELVSPRWYNYYLYYIKQNYFLNVLIPQNLKNDDNNII